MRWKKVVGVVSMCLATAAGCKQQCYLTECDANNYLKYMPAGMECMSEGPGIPAAKAALTAAPTTVNNPERPPHFVTLAECIAVALEQGNIGDTGLQGNANEIGAILTSNGSPIAQNVRALAIDPAISGLDIDRALSKFDAVWTSSMQWTTTDRPVGTPLDTFQAGNSVNAIKTQAAQLQTGILKPLPTGGVAGLTFTVPYQLTNLPSRVNPSYQPDLQFQFEQPLLQGFGVEINQLRPNHPGSVLTPGVFNTQPTQEGILLTRIRFDSQRADFERNVQEMVTNVEVAYWNLYGSYWTLYAQEAALRQAFEAWKINRIRFDAGRATLAEFAQSRGQYELFRGQRLDALAQVLESERQLRRLMNLPVEDGFRLVPADSPTLAPYVPDWMAALNEALALSPVLVQARNDLKLRQLSVIEQKNFLLPDLRFTATYDINSIGNRLDGADGENALRNLASNHFNNWALGLRLNVPIGYRFAFANVRAAQLALARSYLTLQEEEMRTNSILAFYYRELQHFHAQIAIQRAQREAYADQLRARFEEFRVGKGTLDILLEAQRFWAQALSQEYANIVQYNNTLARFEFAKGTILRHNNITINEGPLPECAHERAVEHERQRTLGLVLAERAAPVPHPQMSVETGNCGLPELPQNPAPLPSLLEKAPVMKEVPDLPPVEKKDDKKEQAKDAPTAPPVKSDEVKATPQAQPLGAPLPTGTPTGKDRTIPLALPPLPPAPTGAPAVKEPSALVPRTSQDPLHFDGDKNLPPLPPTPTGDPGWTKRP